MHEDEVVPLAERKVVRRGLMAGIAALGAAAMLKVTGADKAEAAPDFELNVKTNVGTAETRLSSTTPPTDGPVFQVVRGSTTQTFPRGAITGRNTLSTEPGVAGTTDFNGGVGVSGSVLAL